MQINNSTSQSNFGMAKWASQKAMVKFFNAATKADYTLGKAHRYIETIKNNTAKNVLMDVDGKDIILRLPNSSICKYVYFECPPSPDFPSKVTDRQSNLLAAVMIEQARRGNLDTAVETLKKELPELTEKIDSFAKNDILQDINKYGKEL